MNDPAREVALDVIAAVRERDSYANLLLPQLLRQRGITGRDAALATELTYGTVRSHGLLTEIICAASGREINEIDSDALDILELGTYQLLRTRIGAHAAVNTSVELLRSRARDYRAVGFVNAVLRTISKKSEEIWVQELAPDFSEDPQGYLAFRYAHPRWIVDVFNEALGGNSLGNLQALLAADDDRPLVHLVAKPGLITAEELALLVDGECGRWSPYAVYLAGGGDPGKLEPLRDGLAGVQDEGSQLVARTVAAIELEGTDSRWLDLCAGPGGKAVLLGALAEIAGAKLDAVEPSEHRSKLVSQAVKGLPVTVHTVDGRSSGLTPGYDRILVDAPCSGLGALRRRPEARWRKQPSDISELVRLQSELLTAAVELLRPGGVLVYSTCSPHPAETVAVVNDVLAQGAMARLDISKVLAPIAVNEDGTVQLWPHQHGTDAMFIAALRKL